MTAREGRHGTASAAAQVAVKQLIKKGLLLKLGVPVLIVALILGLLLLVMTAAAVAADSARPSTGPLAGTSTGGGGPTAAFDAGNIFSDQVFYNANTMSAAQIQTFLDQKGCDGACLRNTQYTWQGGNVAWCKPVPAGAGSFAVMLETVSKACSINPQVAMVMIEKESQGLTRPPPAALTGFGCPDTGAGGSANCDSGSSGVWAQTWGMAQAFAHLRGDPTRINYPVGQVSEILWNVAETGCGSGPVLVQNKATATLYTYTPYQPNAASLAAYPGEGDRCSAYGNRNAFVLFQKYFGDTGGGKAPAGAAGASSAGGGVAVTANGVDITLPPQAGVSGAIRAPTPQVAKAITAGLSQLNVRYSWGGGDANGPTLGIHDGGIADSFGDYANPGYDCSGLLLFVWTQAGLSAPRDSQAQARSGVQVPWADRLPGDMIGAVGHISLYLGVIDGQDYMLEAPQSGLTVRVAPVRSGHYPDVARIWGNSGRTTS